MTSTCAYEAVVLAKVPFKTLSKVGEDPNYVELSKLQRGVYQNCAAVPSSFNGNNGHLGLVMPAADYTTHNNGNPYVASPNHPRNYDTTIGANARRVLQSQQEAEHSKRIDDHLTKQAVLQITKNMLEEALPWWMLIEIEDRETGLNNVNLHDIFDHAFDRRGQIDNALVDEYTTTFNAQLDMAQGFNGYVERQEECHDFFLDAGQP
eukprot:9092173-Ditylum_brightwellii.AAC.1